MDSVTYDLLIPAFDAAVVAWGASCLVAHFVKNQAPREGRSRQAAIDDLSRLGLSHRESKSRRGPDELGLLKSDEEQLSSLGRRLI